MAARSSVFDYIHNHVPSNSENDLPLMPEEVRPDLAGVLERFTVGWTGASRLWNTHVHVGTLQAGR